MDVVLGPGFLPFFSSSTTTLAIYVRQLESDQLSQVKGFASKGKASITAKYSKKEDAIELLNRSSSPGAANTRTTQSLQPRRGDPPSTDIFSDI